MTLRLSHWPERIPSSGVPIFETLDQLLKLGSEMGGWEKERSIRRDPDYGAFWSLLWQLQVMEWLVSLGARVHWNGSGPDLTAVVGEEVVHIECNVPRGCYPQTEYAELLLELIDPVLRLGPSRLPNDAAALDVLFDSLVRDVEQWRPNAQVSASTDVFGTPIMELRRDNYSVRMIPLDGPRPMFPSDHPFFRDDPEYPHRATTDMVGRKQGKNRPAAPGPKILALNFVLNRSYQRAMFSGRATIQRLCDVDPDQLDGVLCAVCGIDRPLRGSAGEFVHLTERVPAPIRAAFKRTEMIQPE